MSEEASQQEVSDIVELRCSDHPLPVDVKKRISAYDFAQLHHRPFTFSVLKREEAAITLEEIAAKIRSGDMLFQEACLYETARLNEYPMTTLTLKFHEKEP